LLEKNIESAALAQVLDIHNQIVAWEVLDQEKLKRMRVLIVGPHGPRSGRVDMQYFTKIYHQFCSISDHKVKNNYLYHVEMLPSQMKYIDIEQDLIQEFLMGSEYNKTVGKTMLNNQEAMFRDILEKAGTKAIQDVLNQHLEHKDSEKWNNQL
jgi:hypothetical protein